MKAIVDCNSFYCTCERLFRPELRNHPVVVLSNNDGCIISRTDEAKAAGVAMGVPYFQARDIIQQHQVATFSSNYALYGELSSRVMETMRTLLGEDRVEVYSVDEAFLDLDGLSAPEGWAVYLRELKATIEQWTGIQVSIGAASTKVLAKLANRLAKKDKQGTACVYVLTDPAAIQHALLATPVDDVWGIGRRYAAQLKEQHAVFTAADLSTRSEAWAKQHLGGVIGMRLWRELQGIPSLQMRDPLTTKKMIATTRMFGKPVTTLTDLCEATATYATRAAEKLRRQQSAATRLEVFVVPKQVHPTSNGRFRHGQSRYAVGSFDMATQSTAELIRLSRQLTEQLFQAGERYVKAGVMVAGLVPANQREQHLFAPTDPTRVDKLMAAVDNINISMRNDILRFAATGVDRNWKMRQEHRSPRYTTRWNEVPVVH